MGVIRLEKNDILWLVFSNEFIDFFCYEYVLDS